MRQRVRKEVRQGHLPQDQTDESKAFVFKMLILGTNKLPLFFKMPCGYAMVIDVYSISSQYHEPTIQLLEFDNGDKLLRFCSYSHGRFSRSPLMIDEKDLRRLGKAIVKGKEIRKFVSKLNQ